MLNEWFVELSPLAQALVASGFTWFCTAAGAATVFFVQQIRQKLLDGMLGSAAGVMIAASFWSLLAPAIEMAQEQEMIAWLVAAVGFLSGGLALWSIDHLLPHLHTGMPTAAAEGVKTSWHRCILLVLAVTIHNIPEGLAVGIAFGAVAQDLPSASLGGAIALTIGMGLQNFPEGAAVSLPLRREGLSRRKSFWYGQLSGIVEPLAALIGASAVMFITPLLPYALAFAAGAMIFVVVEELIPASQRQSDSDVATIGALLGFTLMMILDVAFSG